MGCVQSHDDQSSQPTHKNITPDPLISKLRSSFRLQTSQKTPRQTTSFIHALFSQQILKSNIQRVPLRFSPFVSIQVVGPDKKMTISTCAIISPILAIAPAKNICDTSGYSYHEGLKVEGVAKSGELSKKVKKIIPFMDNVLALLILQEPLWQLGWCGLKFVQRAQKTNDIPLFMLKNQLRQGKQKSEAYLDRVEQKIMRVYSSEDGPFQGKSVRSDYGLFFQIIDRKPYILGLQINTAIYFLDEQTFRDIQNVVRGQLTSQVEKNYLKSLDLQQMQIDVSW